MSLNETNIPFHFAFTSDPRSRYLLLTVFILQQVLGNTLLLGLLWYERNGQDLRRTLYNQMFSMSFTCVFLTNVTTQVVGFIIIYYSPGFPEWFCWIKDLVTKFTLIYGSLFTAQLSILKYCYVILWKRVIAIDDDFVATYLVVLNVTLSFYGALFDHLWNGPHVADMCVCMDVNWSTYYPYEFKNQTPGTLAFLGICFLIDLGLAVRVFIYNIASSRNPVHRLQKAVQVSLSSKSCVGKFVFFRL